MEKYNILVNILDALRSEAPTDFSFYHPNENDVEKLNHARSKAYIHLFLKVKCGLMSFRERNDLITDGSQDGGLDAYYIDREKKKLYLIQSKFRTTEFNFIEKSIVADDLVKMEIDRILKGEKQDSRGLEFNDKVKSFQVAWRNIPDHANYEYIVVFFGNLRNYSDEQVKRLIENYPYLIYDHKKTYDELVFPLCSGVYYEPNQIEITINLGNKEQPTLKQRITTKYGDFRVIVVFVPANEIGRILHKYKNSILKYNPRNYLSLSQNKVNQKIRDSIVNSVTNDFAILNNGITIICDSFNETTHTGEIDMGQIIIKNPQIINGGQTAYTLSKVYEANINYSGNLSTDNTLKGKEVLLKAIITNGIQEKHLSFIEEISNATNQQSRVEEADRRSNEPVQLELQKYIYEEFGLFYERKKGEFFNGIEKSYIHRDFVIDRDEFFRAYMAFTGQPRWARQRGSDILFARDHFINLMNDASNYRDMVFSYRLLRKLYECEKNQDKEVWGFGLRYGKMAIISAIAYSENQVDITKENLDSLILEGIVWVKPQWRIYEDWVREKPENRDYLNNEDFDYNNYYKGKTVDQDIVDFFSKTGHGIWERQQEK